VFEFVGNVFSAVSEILRAGFNAFEFAGNLLAVGLGKFLEGLGSWASSGLEQLGKEMQANASKQASKNFAEAKGAVSNAGAAAERAVFGGNAAANVATPTTDAARQRMNDPAAKEERDRIRKKKQDDEKAARAASAAAAKGRSDLDATLNDFGARRGLQDAIDKANFEQQEKVAAKQKDIDAITAERADALRGKSNEALKANDVRSGEGMAQFLALASGREDPAIAEYRKQTQKLDEIRGELRALQQDKVDILGAAA
jgi:hypothetical protein